MNSCVFYLASMFPPSYINAIIIGTVSIFIKIFQKITNFYNLTKYKNLSGIFTTVISIISKACKYYNCNVFTVTFKCNISYLIVICFFQIYYTSSYSESKNRCNLLFFDSNLGTNSYYNQLFCNA
jgi:hypothetical protein